jgi:polar amino acid transport system substrate-binding protein
MNPYQPPSNEAWRESVVLAYIDEPPFAKPDLKIGAIGCDVELALTVLGAIGVKRVETHLTTFAELIPGVAARRWDMNVPLFVTAERSRTVAFSRPVWALRDGFIVVAGNPKGLQSYRSVVQATDAQLGVITGQVQHHAALQAGVLPSQIRQFETQHLAVDALRAGLIDAYASTALGNRTFVREFGDPMLQAVALESDAPAIETSPPVGAFSFAPADVELRERFDAYLEQYLGSPLHRERMAAYGLSESEIDPILSSGKYRR